MVESEFKFEFSLAVLNHLGRGLYRNFATVIAEAVSNSWDAGATEVKIYIDKDSKTMSILDNGHGMNGEDFQHKFLKVGYSRREEDVEYHSQRKILGRKGIGKLALLSVSNIIKIATRKDKNKLVSVQINNSDLDRKINKKEHQYVLPNSTIDQNPLNDGRAGTYIVFDQIKPHLNEATTIKRYLATLFNFSVASLDQEFKMYVNGDLVSADDLSTLNESTQYCWVYGSDHGCTLEMNAKSRFIKLEKPVITKAAVPFTHQGTTYDIRGYIASVRKPSDLQVRGSGQAFKAGLHLYVNGRLRQEDIFKDITSYQIAENYLYGEIHVDGFDDGEDIFTSNREGVIKDDERYKAFLLALPGVQRAVLDDWDEWRVENNKDDMADDPLFPHFKQEKREAISNFLNHKDNSDLNIKHFKRLINSLQPKGADKYVSQGLKKILICHASEDVFEARVVESLLLFSGFTSSEIIFTSSDHSASTLPDNTNIFNYIRDFLIQDFIPNPLVFFVLSNQFENSWYATTEAGASWVARSSQCIAVIDGYKPNPPLNQEHNLFFDLSPNNLRSNDAFKIFRDVAAQHDKKELNENAFKEELSKLVSERNKLPSTSD